nr:MULTISPECIES: EAL domain-containing protein [unclassified Lactonifactor]
MNLSLVQIRDRANIARKNAKRSYGELFSFVFYSDMERQQMIKEKDIENRMEDALREGEFTVFLQPKIEPEHNTVKGAEALVRWQTREGGFMMPGDFIPFLRKMVLLSSWTCMYLKGPALCSAAGWTAVWNQFLYQ